MPPHGVQIIPVIDLMGGQVVRGVGGNRNSYAPVESCVAHDSTPGAVAMAFANRFSATTVYVADLDAIRGSEPDWNSLDQIAAAGMSVWLDCGVSSAQAAATVQRAATTRSYLDSLIVGLESIRSHQELAAIYSAMGNSKAIFSLDLKQGRPLAQDSDVANASPLEIAESALDSGFERMIVLDLAFVGTSSGVGVVSLCRQLRSRFPKLEIHAGGGIRATADIQLLADAGCNGVLVASALHDGSITPSDLESFYA
jgi:phosphoribosylformimino-5-aminoimidazole carboxamide ribotide isomerase